jgi:starch phosphorylase
VLDGWWAEGYSPDAGWAVGSGEQYEDPEENDAVEAEALYTLLEREVIPLFFQRDSSGRPREWTAMMTAAIGRLGAAFSTGRMVRDYAERAYLPAHRHAVALQAGDGEAARELVRWRRRMADSWPEVGVRSSVRGNGPVAVGSGVEVEALVRLGRLSADDVRVEVVAGEPDGEGGLSPRAVVAAVHQGAAGGEQRFVAEVPASVSGRLAFASRVVPVRPNGGGPDPAFLIAWEPD